MILSNMLSMAGGGGSSSGRNNKGTLTINLPKTNYLFGERFSLTGATIIFTPRRGNPVDVTDQVINSNSITPADNTVWDIAGEQTVRAVYVTDDNYEIYGKVVVNVAEEGKGYLAVTTSRSEYNHGDQFNTSVLSITFVKADGTETSIDPANVFVTTSPENGDTFEIDGPNTLIVSYDYAGESQSQTAINPAPAYVKITVKPVAVTLQVKLKQTGCKVHGIVIYDQSVLTVTYSDGTQKRIVYGNNPEEDAKITWDPHERTTLDEAGETEVTVTYTEHGYSISASSYIKVTKAKLKGLTFTLGKTTFNAGDTIDITDMGAAVVASYSDGSTRVVTKYCDISPSRGTWQVGDTKVTVTYEENDVSLSESKAVKVNDVVSSLSVSIAKNSYEVGESITYEGSQCIARYSSGKEEDIPVGAVSFNPPSGTQCTQTGSVFVTATWHGLTARTSVSVHEKRTTGTDANGNAIETTITDLTDANSNVVTVIPTSVEPVLHGTGYATSVYQYNDGDTIKYAGLSLKLLDKDGNQYTSLTGEEPYKRGYANYSERLNGTEFVFPTKIARLQDAQGTNANVPPFSQWDLPAKLSCSEFQYFRVSRRSSSGYPHYRNGCKAIADADPVIVTIWPRTSDVGADGRFDCFILAASKSPFWWNVWNGGMNPGTSETSDEQLREYGLSADRWADKFTYANKTVYMKIATSSSGPDPRYYTLSPGDNNYAIFQQQTEELPNINPYSDKIDKNHISLYRLYTPNNTGNKAGLIAWRSVYGQPDGEEERAYIPVEVPVKFNKFSKTYETSIEILVGIGPDGSGISTISGTDRTAFMQNLNALEADPTVEVVSTSQEETADGIVYTIRYRKIS